MGLLNVRARWAAIGVVAAALAGAAEPSARAQAPRTVRVGVAVSAGAGSADSLVAGFRRAYADAGVSLDLVIRRIDAGDRVVWDRPVDLVLALGSGAARAVEQDDPNVPVIASMVLRPGDLPRTPRATGVYLELPLAMELQWIKRVLPGRRRVGVVYSAENDAVVARAREIARAEGLELVARRVGQPADLPDAVAEVLRDAEVLWGIADAVVLTPESARTVMLAALRSRVPFVGLARPWVKAGALYALDRDYADIGRQCASLAAQALRDGPAAPRPQPPDQVVLTVNQRTAEQLRITIPPTVLRSAAEVLR